MKIVSVTACTVGIAHTFMAESALKKAASKLNYEINVETQGSMGIENRLKEDDIKIADIVILAIDAKISGMERFEGKKILEITTSDVIHNVDKVMEQALKIVKGEK